MQFIIHELFVNKVYRNESSGKQGKGESIK